MKTIAKFGFFVIFLVGFGIISSYVYADSGDDLNTEPGNIMDSGTTGETGTTINTYTVNFVTNGGGVVESQTVNEGEKLDILNISVHRDGYSFSGWYTESEFVNEFDIENDTVTSNLTLYAKWREHKIIVRYHPEGGKDLRTKEDPAVDPLRYKGGNGVRGGAAVSELYYNGNDWNINTAAPDYIGQNSAWNLSKRGYVGHTWRLVGSTGADAIKLSTTKRFSQNRKIAQEIGKLDEFKAGDIEMDLYVDWTLENYTLTYSGIEECTFVDGDNPTTYTILSGDITLNNPSKTGYTFLGRSGTDIKGLSTNVTITGDSVGNRVFEAVWQINSYTITYDIDGNNKNIVTGDYDSNIVPPQDPERNGYKFLGWEPEIPEKMPAENITITAKWEKNGYSGGGGKSSGIKNDSDDNGKDKTNEDKKSENISELNDNGNNNGNIKESNDDEIIYSGKIDLDDLMSVYIWAHDNGVTTGETLEAALPDGYIKRGEMAKLIVDFVENVLGREVPTEIPSQCSRGDEKEWGSSEIGIYAKKSCALGLMGIYMKNFKPNKLLDRAEFGTIVSRILWGEKYNIPNATNDNKYYVKHLNEVKKENLITQIENPETIKELRKWIWTVLQKIKK